MHQDNMSYAACNWDGSHKNHSKVNAAEGGQTDLDKSLNGIIHKHVSVPPKAHQAMQRSLLVQNLRHHRQLFLNQSRIDIAHA